MKTKFILILAVLFSLTDCGKEPVGNTYQFETLAIADLQSFTFDNKFNINPSRVCLTEKFILLYSDEAHVNHYFHLYKHDGSYITSFGAKEGPNSFYQADCFCQFIKQDDNLSLVSYDYTTNYITEIDLNAVLNGHSDILTSSYKAPDMYMPKSIYFNKNSNSIFGVGGGANGVAFNFNINKKELFWSAEKPLIDKNYSQHVTDLIYTANSSIDEENNIFSIAYTLFNRIDQYDLNGNFQQSIYYQQIEDIEPIIINDFPDPANKIQFSNINSKYGYHYLIYHGLSSNHDKKTYKTQIHIIDYAGRAIKAVQLPSYIADFALIDKNNLMFLMKIESDSLNNLYTLNIDF